MQSIRVHVPVSVKGLHGHFSFSVSIPVQAPFRVQQTTLQGSLHNAEPIDANPRMTKDCTGD